MNNSSDINKIFINKKDINKPINKPSIRPSINQSFAMAGANQMADIESRINKQKDSIKLKLIQKAGKAKSHSNTKYSKSISHSIPSRHKSSRTSRTSHSTRSKHSSRSNKTKHTSASKPQIIGGLKQYGYSGVEYLTKDQRKVALKRALKDIHPNTLIEKIEGVAILTKNRHPNRSKIFYDDVDWIKNKWNNYRKKTKNK